MESLRAYALRKWLPPGCGAARDGLSPCLWAVQLSDLGGQLDDRRGSRGRRERVVAIGALALDFMHAPVCRPRRGSP